MTDAIHKIVTDRMIAALQRGTIPWRKPWRADAGQPRSMTTGQPYRGANIFLLSLTAADEGYASPFWGTYRQITGLGGQVRQGERSTMVVFWKKVQAERRDPQTGETTLKTMPVLRYYRVFNAAQADDLPDRFHPAPGEHNELREPQAVLDQYLADGPKLLHVAGDRADYHPATDTIRLPPPAQFHTSQDYYATAFHEAGHSTGHPTRLNRPGIAAFDHFGSGRYAREELIAQMTSSILCAQTGIDDPGIFGNSAAYIANWLTALGNDHKLVITAAGHAQRASDLISQAEREPARESDRRPEPAYRQWTGSFPPGLARARRNQRAKRARQSAGRPRSAERQGTMAQIARDRAHGELPGRLTAWLERLRQWVSGRVYAGSDAFAREHGWQIITATGRFGFGARVYRDPRFGHCSAAVSRSPERAWGRPDARSG
jgi:antirestriction protein ArdC